MASLSPHKPRRRVKKSTETPFTPEQSVATRYPVTRPAYPLAAILWPARGFVSQWKTLPLILMVTGLFRWAAGLWKYSGYASPPMHGDYEAQRHWMELTNYLPISQWYFHDLPWWGLDYPPLTAYHSWLLGRVGRLINPAWFELYTSRRLDDADLKIYMRATVVVSEYLIAVPAAVILVRRLALLYGVSLWTASIALTAILMQPATLLVDHGHFQYNTVMLGLTMASMSSLLANRHLWACVFFVLALGFKQMALYYAPAMFAYLLGICLSPRVNLARLVTIALVTISTFVVLVLPILLGALWDRSRGIEAQPELEGRHAELPLFSALFYRLDPYAWYYPVVEQGVQMLHRVFPFARGLFEDKVANFWCALNLVIKLRQYPSDMLQRASLLLTTAGIMPPCLILLLRPRKDLLVLALATTAWAFFLFSFQVHEKSVLLPLMPMTALLSTRTGLTPPMRAWIGYANLLGVWTMYPLLSREELRMPYAVLTLLWAYLLGLPPTSWQAYKENSPTHGGILTQLIHGSTYTAMAVWHIAEATTVPPVDKPDLFVVLNVAIGACGFAICYAWCLIRMLIASNVLGSAKVENEAAKKAKAS